MIANKQVQIYSVGGNYFYNKEENKIHSEMLNEMNIIGALERFALYSALEEAEKKKYTFNSYEDIKNLYEMRWSKDFTDEEEKLFNSKKYIKRYFTGIEKKYNDRFEEIKLALKDNNDIYINANKLKEDKKKELDLVLKENNEVRKLNTTKLSKYDKISLFDSNLIRVMELEFNKLSKELLIVEITQHIIMDSIISKGFDWEKENGELEHYIFLVSSAGQVRKQKLVMISETKYKKIADILTAGLTLEIINSKENGGCNVNKYLAYLSLNSSSSEVWENFNIDECIVLNDFESEVIGTVDYIGTKEVEQTFDKLDTKGNKYFNENGKIVKEKRTVKALTEVERVPDMRVPIEHSDGCGWILPELSEVNFMCRLNWIKGLLTPCDYIKWIELFNEGNYKVTDIDDREWDLKEDNIKVIFFKSQFKMHKYYKNILNENGEIVKYGWDVYKDNFKGKNGWDITSSKVIRKACVANKCNEEPKNVKDFKQARFTYQMLQTLVNMKEDELKEFTNPIKDLVGKAYVNRKTQLNLLGATKTNKKLTNFQNALMLYPALLKDEHVKEELSTKITALKNDAREGKFSIKGSAYTFIIPDVFAWMQNIFLGQENPCGLLEDGQVYCNIFKEENELLVNRSPHCYAEHAVRKNFTGSIKYQDKEVLLSDWFITNGVYTSSHDLITKLIQNDNDGDKSLVIKGSLVAIADREMKAMNVVPLYYEMEKADAEVINEDSIIKSLKSAFKFGNIGTYSNKLTKIWNSEERDVKTAKILCALNNFFIDGAKTNYCPEVFSSVKEEVKEFKIDQRTILLQRVEALKAEQKLEKQKILFTIIGKEAKKAKRTELNELYKEGIVNLKIKLNFENTIKVAEKKEDILKTDMSYKIKTSDKDKLPYFFKYAKNMKTSEVEEMNDSTVNKACKLIDEIPQGTYNFGEDKFNSHYLANNFKISTTTEVAVAIIEKYKILNNQMKSYFAQAKEDDSEKDGVKIAIAARVYATIRNDFEVFVKELGIDIVDATDIVVRNIYRNNPGCKKAFLFDVLGDIILTNIQKNIKVKTPRKSAKKGFLFCSVCGKEVKRESNRQKMCKECAKELIKAKDKKRKSKK